MQTYSVFSEEASTSRTLNNIRKTLISGVNKIIGKDNKNIVEKILKIHGLSEDRFDFVSKMEDIITGHLNDESIDSNSNKSDKTIEGLYHEVTVSVNKAVGYDMLYRMMVEMYNKEEAKKLTEQLYTYALALHDSTNILKNYCYSFDMSIIVMLGRNFGVLPSTPPKRLSSYISALNESIHQISGHLAGACAIATLFFDSAKILLYREKISLERMKKDLNIRKYIENNYQCFVHSVNHLSRNAVESPFSNISILDSLKIKKFIKELEWYFPIDKELNENIISEYIMELQKIFIEFFNKGDPINGGLPYRFPISTIVLTKENGEILDEKFLKYICNKDIYRFNIFVSEGDKFASCCRLLSDKEMLNLAGEVNSFGGTGLSMGSHRVVTINFNRIALESESLEGFYLLLKNRIEDTAKILKAHKNLIIKLADKGLQQFVKMGWINMSRMFSTFGILGINECVKILKKKYAIKNINLEGEILVYLNSCVNSVSREYQILGNIEQVPGESMAIRLAKVDRLLYGEKYVSDILYANQFVPLWEDCSIWDRLKIDGKYNQLLTGGGIVHTTIGEKVTPKQAENLIKYAIKVGCEHFALNSVYCKCKENHVNLGRLQVCPVCGKSIIDYMTRVVGMFTRVSQWEKERREWEFPKRSIEKLLEEKILMPV